MTGRPGAPTMAQILFVPGSQPKSQRFDFVIKKKCHYNSHLNSETPSPMRIAKYSLWFVYNLVARLELILQSSPSQRGSETHTRATAFSSGYWESQISQVLTKIYGLASNTSASAMSKKAVQLELSNIAILFESFKYSIRLTLLQWRPIPIRKLSGLMSLCIKFFVCTYSILLIICKTENIKKEIHWEQHNSLTPTIKHDFLVLLPTAI